MVMEAVLKTVTTVLEATHAHAMLDMRKVAFMDVLVRTWCISLLNGQQLSHIAYGRY